MKKLQKIVVLAVMTFPFAAQAQVLSENRWKESERRDRKDRPLAYTDTLHLTTDDQKSFLVRRNSFAYKGTIEKGKLDIGLMVFEVVQNRSNQIILKKGDISHVFSRVVIDTSENYHQLKKHNNPDQEVGQINTATLDGKWSAYKRNSRSGPLTNIDYSTLLSKFEYNSEDGTGKLYNAKDGNHAFLTLKRIEGGKLIVTDNDNKEHALKVFEQTEKELIIEGPQEILYYFRKF